MLANSDVLIQDKLPGEEAIVVYIVKGLRQLGQNAVESS